MLRQAHVPSPTLGVRDVAAALARPLDVDQAEARLERLIGAPTVLFASARGALATAVAALAPEGRVAVPGYTCVAVANAIAAGGATAVWTDVDRRGLVPAERWPGADLCLVQDTYGFTAPLPPGDRLVLRDAAHRADGLFDRPAGIALTVTSLEQSKCLSAGQGGVAVTEDGELAATLRRLRDRHPSPGARRLHAVVTLLGLGAGRAAYRGRRVATELLNRLALAVAPDRVRGQSAREIEGGGVEPALLGRPSRAVSALALSQLARIGEIARHRSEIVRAYDDAAGVERDPEPLLRYPMVADDPPYVAGRMREAGWELGRPWFVSPLHPCERPPRSSGYAPGTAPEGEWLARHVVNLPTHPLVDRAAAGALVEAALAAGARPLR